MDVLAIYMRQIRKLERAPKAELPALAKAARLGDLTARNRLIESCLLLVVLLANRYRGQGLCVEDLIQFGNMGLMRAVQKWEPERGGLTTYAGFWIKQAIRAGRWRLRNLVRLPAHWEYHAKPDRDVSHEAMREMRIVWSEVGDLKDVYEFEPAARQEAVDQDDDDPLMPSVPATANDLRRCLEKIEPKRRDVLRRRINGDKLATIAESLGVSRERVRQFERDALRAVAGELGVFAPAMSIDKALLLVQGTRASPRFTTENLSSLSHKQRRIRRERMVEMLATGKSVGDVASAFNVTTTTVLNARREFAP